MYENQTSENVIERMLGNVESNDSNLDTRPSSPIYNAVGPSGIEVSNLYGQLDFLLQNVLYGDTATRDYLIPLAADRGMAPYPATPALCRGLFLFDEYTENTDIAMGTRFSFINSAINYAIVKKETANQYLLECETAGAEGNKESGMLIPIDNVPGLVTAELSSVLIPGEDEEETELFRQRYIESFTAQSFGGNEHDYKEFVNSLDGVGGVKIFPVWNGGYTPSQLNVPNNFDAWFAGVSPPANIKTWLSTTVSAIREGVVTVGNGTVHVYILAANGSIPTPELIDRVQTAVDPEENHGEGLGMAPIGHYVEIKRVKEFSIDISFSLSYQAGYDWSSVGLSVKAAIDNYFAELAKNWQNEENTVVRISQIETRILDIQGVVDVMNTTLNGISTNIELNALDIPKRGEVIAT